MDEFSMVHVYIDGIKRIRRFLEDELKMGHLSIGIIEGIAVSSSFLSKFFLDI